MNSDEKSKRLQARFSGRVQGVGFRFTVCRIAEELDVTGFVRNIQDGDVELIAEGAEPVLSDFLQRIRNSQLRDYIFQDRVNWQDPTGEFKQFGVAF